MDQVTQYVNQVVNANIEYAHFWRANVLWTWQWWLECAITFFSVAIWVILRKKNSTGRLLFIGFVVLTIAMWMDFIGHSFGLWYYPYKVVPSLPPFVPWESLIPTEILLFLQYQTVISPWVKAIGLGLLNSFVLEPVSAEMGLYMPVHWRYIYSFPIYMVIYLVAHYISKLNTFQPLDKK